MKTQKINFKNSRGLNLAGIIHFPDKKTDSMIILSHGFAANKDRLRLIKASDIFSKNGYAVLRFDALGSGESDNAPISVANYEDGLKSAIKYVRKKGYGNIGLLGESLGGLSSILAYDNKIKTIVLWAPVTKSKTPTILQREELQRELNDRGYTFYYKDGKNFKIPKEYLNERKSINQKKILSKIKCPVLIIHGNKDDTIPLKHSREALRYLLKESKLEIISSAGHKLEEKLNYVINLSLKWFKKYLK